MSSVWVLDDLIVELERQGRSPEDARAKVDGIMADMKSLTTDLFRVRSLKQDSVSREPLLPRNQRTPQDRSLTWFMETHDACFPRSRSRRK